MTDDREQERREQAMAWLNIPNEDDGYAEDYRWAASRQLNEVQEGLVVGFMGGHRSRDAELAAKDAEIERLRAACTAAYPIVRHAMDDPDKTIADSAWAADDILREALRR